MAPGYPSRAGLLVPCCPVLVGALPMATSHQLSAALMMFCLLLLYPGTCWAQLLQKE